LWYNWAGTLDGWIKSGRDRISASGLQIGYNVHHTDEKLKDYRKDKWTSRDITKK
jgi:hypothetical protein